MTIDDLSDPQAAIVGVLRDGRATTGYLAEKTAYSSPHLNTQVQILRAMGVIRTLHEPTALHELSETTQRPPTPIEIASDETLSPAETAIVEVLRDGRATTGYLGDEVDYSSSHINTHLRLLLAKGIIRKIHPPTALYKLTNENKNAATDSTNETETTDH